MKTTNKGGIPANVGFPKGMQGSVSKAITIQHTRQDEGRQFTDSFGRKYVYTSKGCIY